MARYEFADTHGTKTVRAPIEEGPGAPPLCDYCGSPLRRVYSLALGNRRQLVAERDFGGSRALRDQFLPTAKDFASATDPDGSKGLREWGNTHQPKKGNKTPLWPDIPKASF